MSKATTRVARGPKAESPATKPAGPMARRWVYEAAQPYTALRCQEWLLTNGLGGFAMGTAAGVSARRYHALLIAATRPPVGRIAALNGMQERIELRGRAIEFSSFEFNGRSEPMVHPDGHTRLQRFERDEAVRWVYAAEGIELTRELVIYAGTNAAGLRYTLRRTGAAEKLSAKLTIRPLVSLRDFHSLIRRSGADDFKTSASPNAVSVERLSHTLMLESIDRQMSFVQDDQWWYDFFYVEDAHRGQDCVEDLFSPGHFELALKPGADTQTVELLAWLGGKGDRPTHSFADELHRRRERSAALATAAIPSSAPAPLAEYVAILAQSADAYVVARRDDAGKLSGVSTIAGYPWFSDWGRDSFISLDGLLLSTGRHDEARRELEAFAAARRNGIIPNVFNDQTGKPEYNTVDASLWFVHAACRWLEATNDRAGFESIMLGACIDVINHYRRGTDFNIAMDPIDKLVTAGTNATQLTWMDAQRDGVTFTPRHGKAVEINALWFNALCALSHAAGSTSGTLAADLRDLADAVGNSFAKRFWDPHRRCLFDCLVPGDSGNWTPDDSIRPNQIFAVSLPHSPLTHDQRAGVLDCVRSRLVTPMGVRTLDPADPRYRASYRGTLFERDSAYHQGTAWPWLLGPVAEAALRSGNFSAAARKDAIALLTPILETIKPGPRSALSGTCVGQIAEVYDGGNDVVNVQNASGCPAQAWSVAELLRVVRLAAM